MGYNSRAGTATIRDVDGLARFLQFDHRQLRADPLCFIEDDALVVPWSISELIAQRAAQQRLEQIPRKIEKDEAEHEHHKIYGNTYTASRKNPSWHVDAEHFVDSEHQPYNRPCWDFLRRWCGVEAVTRRDELIELR